MKGNSLPNASNASGVATEDAVAHRQRLREQMRAFYGGGAAGIPPSQPSPACVGSTISPSRDTFGSKERVPDNAGEKGVDGLSAVSLSSAATAQKPARVMGTSSAVKAPSPGSSYFPSTVELQHPIDSEYFSVQQYTTQLLQQETLQGLVETDTRLLREVRRLDQELQELVYRNYSKFISATDTIREMHSHVSEMKTRLSALHDHVNTVEHTSQQVFSALQPHRKRVKETITVNRKLKKACFIKHLPQTMEGLLNDEKYAECVQCWVMGDAFFQKHLPLSTVPEGVEEKSHTHTGAPVVGMTSKSALDHVEATKEEVLQTVGPSENASLEPSPSASLLRTTLSALRRSCWKVAKRLYLQMEDSIAATPLDDPTAIDAIHELVEHLRLLRATSLFVPSLSAPLSSSTVPLTATASVSSSAAHHGHPTSPPALRMVDTEQGEASMKHSASPSVGKMASNGNDDAVSFEESIRQVLMRSVYANFARDMSTTELSLQDAFRLPRPPRAIAASLKQKERSTPLSAPAPSSSPMPVKGGESVSPSGLAAETVSPTVSPLFVPAVQEAMHTLPLPQRHLPLETLPLREPLAHLKSACALLAGNSARIQEVLLLQGGGEEENTRGARRTAGTANASVSLEEEKVSVCVAQHVQPALMDVLEDFRCCFTAWVFTYLNGLFQHLPAIPLTVEQNRSAVVWAKPPTSDTRAEASDGGKTISAPVTATSAANSSSSFSSASPPSHRPFSPEQEENTMTLMYLLYYPAAVKEMVSNVSMALLRHLRLMSVTLKELGNAYLNTPLRQYQSKGYASLVDQCVTDILSSCATLLQEKFQGLHPPLLYPPSSVLPFRAVRMADAAHKTKDAIGGICSECAEMPLPFYSTSALTTFLTILRASDLPLLPSSSSSSLAAAAVLASTPSHPPSSETLLGRTVEMGSDDHKGGEVPASPTGVPPPPPPLPSTSSATGGEILPGKETTTPDHAAVFPSLERLVPDARRRRALVAAGCALSYFHFILTHFACASLVSVIREQLEQVGPSSSSSLSTAFEGATGGGGWASPYALGPLSAAVDAALPDSPSRPLSSAAPLGMDAVGWSEVLTQLALAVAAVTHRAILLEGQSSAARLAAALFHGVGTPEDAEAERAVASPASASSGEGTASDATLPLKEEEEEEEDYLRQWYFDTLLPSASVSPPLPLGEHHNPSLAGGKSGGGKHPKTDRLRPGGRAAPCPHRVHPQFWNVVMVEWTVLSRFLTHSFPLSFSTLGPPTRHPPASLSSGVPSVDEGRKRAGYPADPHPTSLPPPPALHSPPSHSRDGRRHSGAGISPSSSLSSLPPSTSVVQPLHRSRRQKIAVAHLRHERTSLQNHIDAIFLQQTPLLDTTPANGEPSTILRSVMLYVLRSLVDRIRKIPRLHASFVTSPPFFSCTDFTFDHIHLHATFLLWMLLEPPMISRQSSERTPSFRVHPYSGGGSSSSGGTGTSPNSGTSGGDSLFPFILPLSTREWTAASGGWGDATTKLFQREVDELCISAFERRRRNDDDVTEIISSPNELEQCIHASLEAYVSEIYRVAVVG